MYLADVRFKIFDFSLLNKQLTSRETVIRYENHEENEEKNI
jgi:hypothetical protein